MIALADRFTVVGMDQRNAGQSVGAVKADHGWHTYRRRSLRADGSSRLRAVPRHGRLHRRQLSASRRSSRIRPRVPAAVLQNPIGLWENRDTWDAAVKGFGETDARPRSVDQRGDDPVVRQEHVRRRLRVLRHARLRQELPTPLFLQPGTDKPHPAKTSEEIAALAPNIEVQKDWRGPTYLDESIKRVRAFLERNTPKA